MYKISKILVSSFCLSFLHLSVALDDAKSARILKYDFDNIGTGNYHYNFETSNGISRQEEGTLINENTDHSAVVVKGSYSYTGPDGVVYTVRYTADENGFHPEGDHIKVPPFVPWVHHHDHSTTEKYVSTTPTYLPSSPKPPHIVQIPSNQNNVVDYPKHEVYGPPKPSSPKPVQIVQIPSTSNQNVGNFPAKHDVYGPPKQRSFDVIDFDQDRKSILSSFPDPSGVVNAHDVNNL